MIQREGNKHMNEVEQLKNLAMKIALHGPDSDGVKALMVSMPPHLQQQGRMAIKLWKLVHEHGVVMPFNELPKEVQVSFAFGVKKDVTHEGIRYEPLGQPTDEPYQFRAVPVKQPDITPILVKLSDEGQAALNRILNSDAAGISHNEIYGFSVERDLLQLGRDLLSQAKLKL